MQHNRSVLDLPLPEKPQGALKLTVFKDNSKLSFNSAAHYDLAPEFDRLSVSTYYEDLDSVSTDRVSKNFEITPLNDSDLLLDTSGLQSLGSQQDLSDNYEDIELLIQCLMQDDETPNKLPKDLTEMNNSCSKDVIKTPVSTSPTSSGYFSGLDSGKNSPLYTSTKQLHEKNPQNLSHILNPSARKPPQKRFPKTSTRAWVPSADTLTSFKPSKIHKNDEFPRRIKTCLQPAKRSKIITNSTLLYIPPAIRLSKSQTNLPHSGRTSLERYSSQQCQPSEKHQSSRGGTLSSLGLSGRLTKAENKLSPSTLSGRIIWHETSI